MASAFRKLGKSLSLKFSSSKSSSSDSHHSPPASLADVQQPARLSAATTSSSSSGSRHYLSLSRSFSSRSTKKTCPICLVSLETGQGAIFTAECSHSFHFSCISTSVQHGNRLCPICRCKWKDVPFKAPTNSQPQRNSTGQARVSPDDTTGPVIRRNLSPQSRPCPEPAHFSDDEPLPDISLDDAANTPPSHPKSVTVKSFPEYPDVAASESFPSFGVLVSIRAPPLHNSSNHLARAPIDLVTMLDVSGSMGGSKIALVKRALRFVIHNLGPSDRLSIVTFSSVARRIFPLRRMSDSGREDAILSLSTLCPNGGTNIAEGLKKGVRVLEERRMKNPVASIILLSDGRDTHNYDQSRSTQASSNARQVSEFMELLPSSICPSNNESGDAIRPPTIPVHTFGFGADHDSSVMHAISDSSGGMFSFIESIGIVQDAFAMCIGGLLSVVAQEFQLSVKSLSSGVQIGSIPSGRYKNEISDHGLQGVVEVGSLYADEEKEFLVYLSVPPSPNDETTPLLDICCSYKDSVTSEMIRIEGERVVIGRPRVLASTDMRVSLEVDRQRNRLQVTQGIAAAQTMAEMGNLEGAQAILAERRVALLSSASAQAGDPLCHWLEQEIREIADRMASRELYEHTGRAYVLSGLSSHSWQRATTRGDTTTQTIVGSGGEGSRNMAYETPSMVNMVTKSQVLRPMFSEQAAARSGNMARGR